MTGDATTGIHYREWGEGPRVLALHGLGLDSSSFTGLANALVDRGFHMMAADLPGFGLTPNPGHPLSPSALAEPVLELASQLDTKPIVMGMSLGGRVALEAALEEPDLFRGLVMLAPVLPFRSYRWAFRFAWVLNPGLAARIPIDRTWPCLKRMADRLEDEITGDSENDWVLRASRRAIYYFACGATRRAFVSAARELALDPADGPESAWTRLSDLKLPAAFVWGEQDSLVSVENSTDVAELVPGAFQIRVPCAGHYDNGPHFRCMERAAADAVTLVDAVARGDRRRATKRNRHRVATCHADEMPVGLMPPEIEHREAV
jgi:pimeloyl-ACP methyl ester carboxylesterase